MFYRYKIYFVLPKYLKLKIEYIELFSRMNGEERIRNLYKDIRRDK